MKHKKVQKLTAKRGKRVRKPKRIEWRNDTHVNYCDEVDGQYVSLWSEPYYGVNGNPDPDFIEDAQIYNTSDLQRIHKWLTQYIAWRKQQRGER